MKLLIVDDHPLFLVGLRHILDDVPLQVTALEASSFDRAFALIESHSDIDWICLDLQLPDGDGFQFLRRLQQRNIDIPVAILSANEEPAIVDRAMREGAVAYLSKSSPKAQLVAAFLRIADGQHVISDDLRAPLEHFRAGSVGTSAPAIKLTRRQREILQLVTSGQSNLAIAEQLHLAESTVKGHVSALYDLLGVGNRAACTSRAIKLKLIDP